MGQIKDALPGGDGSIAVEHLRNWAESGPDLPEIRPPQPRPTTTPPGCGVGH